MDDGRPPLLVTEGDEDLQQLSDGDLPLEDRLAAFERMLARTSGWWGSDVSLRDFTTAAAVGVVRTKLGERAGDRIDTEGIADEALVVFFKKSGTITESPRGFLKGVVRNLVIREIEDFYPELIGRELSEEPTHELADGHGDHVTPSADGRVGEEQDRLLSEALPKLAPALRAVAECLLVRRMSRKETCATLGISPETLRKRYQRMRAALLEIS
jgi:DNA-directed RNA polymerase specialized sigma24 family protein